MGSSSSTGTKFVVNFSIEGSGEQDLKRIAGMFKGLGQTSGGISEGTNNMVELGVQTMITVDAFERLSEVGEGLMRIGQAGLKTYAGIAGMMMEQLSPIEGSMIRLMSVAKMNQEQASHALHLAQDLVQFTPFQESQVVSIIESLGIAKISLDAFNDSTGKAITLEAAQEKGMARLSESALRMAGSMRMTAATAIADLAAMTGQVGYQMETFNRGMQRALQTGQLTMLMDQVPATVRKAIFETTGAKMKITAQKAMNNLFKYLGEQGALGAAVMASDTFEGIKSNFKDLPLVFARAIGGMPGEGGFYDQLKNAFKDLYSSLAEGMKGEEFTKALREAFTPVFTWMIAGIKMIGAALREFFVFVKQHPMIAKAAVTIGFLASALAALGGVLLVTVGSMAALAAAVMALGEGALIALAVSLGVVQWALVGLTAALTAGYAVVKLWQADFAGIRTFFEDVGLVITGVQEALENWNNEVFAITEETARNLERRGLLSVFSSIIVTIRKLDVLWEGFSARLNESWTRVGGRFQASWTRISDAIGRVVTALSAVLRTIFSGFGGGNDKMREMNALGRDWGDILVNVLDRVAELTEAVAAWVDTTINSIPDVIDNLATVYGVLLNMKTMFMIFVDFGTAAFAALAAGAMSAMAVLSPLLTTLTGIVNAVMLLRQNKPKEAMESMAESMREATRDHLKYTKYAAEMTKTSALNVISGFSRLGEFTQNQQEVDRLRGVAQEYRRAAAAPSYTPQQLMVQGYGNYGEAPESEANQWWARFKQKNGFGGDGSKPTPMIQAQITPAPVLLDGQKIGEVVFKHVSDDLERKGFRPQGD